MNDAPTPPASAPAPKPAGSERSEDRAAQEPKHRHRALVWALVVLASIVLVVSMIANWVQTQVLNSERILQQHRQDPPEQGRPASSSASSPSTSSTPTSTSRPRSSRSCRPPPSRSPLRSRRRPDSSPRTWRRRRSPRLKFRHLVATAINGAQQRFVSLIEDKGQFVSTQGGDVTLEYGSFVADLATRLGVDPSTISQIQGFIQQSSTELKQRLTTIQSKIESTRATLSQAQAGTLTPQAQQNLTTLETDAAQLRTTVASLQQKIAGIQPKAPAQLQGRLSDLQGRLAKLDIRLTTVQGQAAAVIKVPSQANIIKLDPTLASLQTRVTDLLNRQAVQHPGEIVIMKSSGLSGLQDLVRVLRNLGFVLPVLALLLYLAAIYLAKGWRRETLIAAGGGILGAALLVLLVRRVIGNGVIDSVASSDAVKPAISSVWNIISAGLRDRARVRARDRAGLHRRRAPCRARPA